MTTILMPSWCSELENHLNHNALTAREISNSELAYPLLRSDPVYAEMRASTVSRAAADPADRRFLESLKAEQGFIARWHEHRGRPHLAEQHQRLLRQVEAALRAPETRGAAVATIERRMIGREVRAKSGRPGAVGYAAVYDSPTVVNTPGGAFTEVVRNGAFDRTIGRDDVRALINHDPSKVCGRTANGSLLLKSDPIGLYTDCDFADTSYCRDLSVSLARKDISGMSFQFTTPAGGDRWVGDTRELLSVNLLDVSYVTFPAYPDTACEPRSLFPNGLPPSVIAHRAGLPPLAELTDAERRLLADLVMHQATVDLR